MTWASLFSRMGMVVFILPLILVKFNELEVSLWFLFIILTRVRDVFDFGLLDNIARTYSYSYKNEKTECNNITEAMHQKIHQIKTFSNTIYRKAAFVCLISLSIIGVIVLVNKIGLDHEFLKYWLALAVLVLSSSIFIYGNQFVSIFVGLNQIALIKYWDTIFAALNIISLLIILLFQPSFLLVVITNALWVTLTVARNAFLFKRINDICNITTMPSALNDKLSKGDSCLIIMNAKREFFSSIFSVGFIQLVNLIISAKFSIAISNQYLLFDNLMEQIKNVARAPFYTKRPSFAMTVSKNNNLSKDMVYLPMFFSHATFISGVLFILLFGKQFLELIESDISFEPILWCVIGFSGFIERFTAIHNQLYVIINNKIITHIYMPITASVAIFIMSLFYWVDNVLLFPIAITIGYLSCFSWKVSKNNYLYFKHSILSFESTISLPFILIFILLFLYYYF